MKVFAKVFLLSLFLFIPFSTQVFAVNAADILNFFEKGSSSKQKRKKVLNGRKKRLPRADLKGQFLLPNLTQISIFNSKFLLTMVLLIPLFISPFFMSIPLQAVKMLFGAYLTVLTHAL